jgi:hypothetical protein
VISAAALEELRGWITNIATARTIVSMGLRLAIPRRVGLHQSPLPLDQPRIILKEKRLFE